MSSMIGNVLGQNLLQLNHVIHKHVLHIHGTQEAGEHVVVDLRQEVWCVKIVTIRLSMIATVVAQNLLQLKAVLVGHIAGR